MWLWWESKGAFRMTYASFVNMFVVEVIRCGELAEEKTGVRYLSTPMPSKCQRPECGNPQD